MLSAVIPSAHGYPAMQLALQPVHQRCVRPGPLVLRTAPLKYPSPTADRDRTVSRRSEPRSRTALMGEQPNPWDLLQPQDATIRHRTLLRHYWRCRLYLHPAYAYALARGRRVIASIDLSPSATRTAISSLRSQSLRGQRDVTRATSHGIVLACVRQA